MQKLSTYSITAMQDFYKHISVKLRSGPWDHWWIQEEPMLETGGKDRGRKETIIWSLTSANFRLLSLKSFCKEVCEGKVWNEWFFLFVNGCAVWANYKQACLLQVCNTFSPSVPLAVQEKLQRRIQVQGWKSDMIIFLFSSKVKFVYGSFRHFL